MTLHEKKRVGFMDDGRKTNDSDKIIETKQWPFGLHRLIYETTVKQLNKVN